jgi:hypothetical protein
MAIILATVSGPREVETFLKIFVNYELYIFMLYKLLKLFRKIPETLLAKHRYILQLKNPLNVAIVQKSAKTVLGRFPLTRAQAACLVRPFVYIFVIQ